MPKLAGFSCKMFRGTAGAETPETEMTNVTDVTINLSAAQISATTRATAGWEAFIQGLKTGSVDFSMMYDADDADYQALHTAFMSGTAMSFFFSDGEGNGLVGDYVITNFSESQPLNDAVSISVSLSVTDSAGRAPTYKTAV